ncbi:STAS domain-containing protein [Streptomyces sp. SID9727]|uniref:STAS domain-containing protein n=1 Tax=Streptomyces sp. SID9727 TaxID=2706114 RepID=UPI0013C5AE50|nr:STAS domain-containing protein [Streptomyces sp. SID9727]NEC65542.1 STAS domain-containing protein [Streptomyces sp. SID9727]
MTTHEFRQAGGPVPALAPDGDVDTESLPALQAQADTALAEHGTVLRDAHRIDFADSSFLHLVLALHDQGDLKSADPSIAVRHLFQLVGADTLPNLCPTIHAAQAATHTSHN